MKLEQIINLKLNNFEIKYPKKMAEGEMENPCWEGYEPVGMKEKDGIMVPNCVPVKEEQSKQEFVIPTPDGGETEDEYIGRCIGAIGTEYDVEGQAYAVCKGTWDEK
jgi:hypothetical protein